MRSRTWAILLAVALLLCLGVSLWLFREREPAERAEVWSDGALVCVLELSEDREITVESDHGTNVVTVRDGKVAVTWADCPDGYCVRRGFCDSGAQIVCLPNRLVIRFMGAAGVDAVAG